MEGLRPHDVAGHQATVEQHGKKQEKGQRIAGGQVFAGQGVGKQRGDSQVANGAHDRDQR